MRRHYLTMMAAKLSIPASGHEVRPFGWILETGAIGRRIGQTRKKRAP